MSYFLFKTEPDAYSFDDFLRDKETVWDGVTNPTAVKFLREMKPGTKWIFYHTGDERTAVGTGDVRQRGCERIRKCRSCASRSASASRSPKPWRKSRPSRSSPNSPLVKIGRLSVVPLTEEQWNWFLGDRLSLSNSQEALELPPYFPPSSHPRVLNSCR